MLLQEDGKKCQLFHLQGCFFAGGRGGGHSSRGIGICKEKLFDLDFIWSDLLQIDTVGAQKSWRCLLNMHLSGTMAVDPQEVSASRKWSSSIERGHCWASYCTQYVRIIILSGWLWGGHAHAARTTNSNDNIVLSQRLLLLYIQGYMYIT